MTSEGPPGRFQGAPGSREGDECPIGKDQTKYFRHLKNRGLSPLVHLIFYSLSFTYDFHLLLILQSTCTVA